MKKNRQRELICWLKEKRAISLHWINISRLFGVISGLLIVFQAWLLASILHYLIIENVPREVLLLLFSVLIVVFILRSWMILLREQVGFYAGQRIRCLIRKKVLNRLQQAGPTWIQGNKLAGSWATLVLEQIDDIHEYYAHYLPQMVLAICIPLMIIIVIFSINWTAALILLITSPLIPFFMKIVGMRAADANQRNFQALAKLSGHFLDRLRGIETLRLFESGKAETENIRKASQDLRKRTMEVLRLAFLSSGVLEFFTSLSIAMIAVYFGFSYLGEINFGYYSSPIQLSAGFLTLILAPEFFQPLRDLGTFYHAKARAIGAADNLKTFLEMPLICPEHGNIVLNTSESLMLEAENLCILSSEGKMLAGPLYFILPAGQRIALVGRSGSGKSSLLNAISGFLSYTGSLRVNGVEIRDLNFNAWRKMLSWIGQNPQFLVSTVRDNVLLADPEANESKLYLALERAQVNEFLPLLPQGLNTIIGEQCAGLSVGQAQRIAIARALLNPCQLLLLDEPTAGLDIHSKQLIISTLNNASQMQSTLMITHQIDDIIEWDNIWVMEDGCIIECGDYATLCAKHGAFFKLLSSQAEEI